MGSRRLGRSTLIKNLVRDLQKLLLTQVLDGTEQQKDRQVQGLVTEQSNANMLKALAAIGTDGSLSIDDKIEQMRPIIMKALESLKLRDVVRPHQVDRLLASLQELLGKPDFDEIFAAFVEQVQQLLDGALADATLDRSHRKRPMTYLHARVEVILKDFRRGKYCTDYTCDLISMAIGYQWSRFRLAEDTRPNLDGTIDAIHRLLEKFEDTYPM